jgi:RNA polymerase sigma-70 factor (ECF subfamily)
VKDPDDGLAPLDQELAVIERLKQGDASAAGELYEWYGDRLYRRVILPKLPVRELAEDVLRDTFRVVLEKIDQFEPRGASIFFWLRRIAINRAIDVYRAYKRKRRLRDLAPIEETIERTMSTPPPSPDRGHELAETRQQVQQSLEQMNPRYAMALRLRLLEDRDREECADLMEVTVGNFDVILHRACKAFRKVYPP